MIPSISPETEPTVIICHVIKSHFQVTENDVIADNICSDDKNEG